MDLEDNKNTGTVMGLSQTVNFLRNEPGFGGGGSIWLFTVLYTRRQRYKNNMFK